VALTGGPLVSPPEVLSGYKFAPVPVARLARAYAIESASYPADEAATEDKLRMRMEQASGFFWGAYDTSDNLQGFICGTLTTSEVLTDESMSEHEPKGKTLCIHSVVVDAALRRKGMAAWMLQCYLQKVGQGESAPTKVLLICKENLVGLYETAGFKNLGRSSVVHGQDPWNDMGLSFRVV